MLFRRVLIAAKQWSMLAVTTPLFLIPTMILAPISRAKSWSLLRFWCETLLRHSLDISWSVDNRSGVVQDVTPKRKGVLYVHLNQQTLLASVLYPVTLPPAKLVVNIEFALLPLLGWSMIALGSRIIVRQHPPSAKRQLQKVINELKHGQDYIISIEGKRSDDGELSPFKKGAVVMAIEAQCEVVPFMTLGEYPLWPRGQLYVRPHGKVDCIVFPKISTEGMTYKDRDLLLNQLRDLAEREKASWERNNEKYLKELNHRP